MYIDAYIMHIMHSHVLLSSSLIHGAWPGNYDAMKLLLKCKADPNHQNVRGNTALHMACERGHEHIIRLLIKEGAMVNLVNVKGLHCYDVEVRFLVYMSVCEHACVYLSTRMRMGE